MQARDLEETMGGLILVAMCGLMVSGIGAIFAFRTGTLPFGWKQCAYTVGEVVCIPIAGFIYYHVLATYRGLPDAFTEKIHNDIFPEIYFPSIILAALPTILYMVYLFVTDQTETWGYLDPIDNNRRRGK